MNVLTEKELSTTRSAADYLPWVESRIEEIGSTDEGKQAIRFRTGLAKVLIEEALPLGIFASHHFRVREKITPVG